MWFLLIAGSCTNKPMNSFHIPGLPTCQGLTVNDLSKSIPLEYHQYEGFKGSTGDSLFPKFCIMFEDAMLVGGGVLNPTQIEQLKGEEMQSLRSDKLLLPLSDSSGILSHIKMAYPQCIVASDQPSETFESHCWSIRKGDQLWAKLVFVPMGIPGFFLWIYPVGA